MPNQVTSKRASVFNRQVKSAVFGLAGLAIMFIGIVSAQNLLQQNQDSRSKAAGSNDNVREQEPSSLSVSCGKTKGNKVEVTFRWQMPGPKPEAMWMGIDKKK